MKRLLMTLTLLTGVMSANLCTATETGKGGVPRYKPAVEVAPSGEANGLVYVFVSQEDGSESKSALLAIPTVKDVPADFSPEVRAKYIAQRATEETARDPEWFQNLTYSKVSGEWVLRTEHSLFVTMDRDYLDKLKAKNGIRKDEAMLHEIIKEIVQTLDPTSSSAWGFTRAEEKQLLDLHLTNAVVHKKNGQDNFSLYKTYEENKSVDEKGAKEALNRAISEYDQAVKENPHDVEALVNLIAVYKLAGATGRSDALQARLDGIQKAMPELLAGNTAANDKKWQEAIQHYTAAIEKCSDCISFHLLLADAYNEAKDKPDEKRVLENIPDEALATASPSFSQFRDDRLNALKP